MGQIIHPDSYERKGPWLLSRVAFEELEQIISSIDVLLQKAFEIEIVESIKSENGDLSDKQLQQSIVNAKNTYPYDRKTNVAYFESKNKTRLEGKSLNEILKDKNLRSFSPKKFHATIRYGNNIKFTIDINRYSDKLEYEINCFDQQINDEIKDSIEQWTEKYKANIYVSFWSNWGDMFSFILLMAIGSFAVLTFVNFENSGKDAAKLEAISLLNKGIDSSNINRAVETILKLESNYQFDKNVDIKQNANPIFLKIFIFLLLLFVFSVIRPKTTIGLGKSKSILSFYKFWIKFVTITIPTLLIISPFLKKIQEWWTS